MSHEKEAHITLSRDLKKAASTLTKTEARFLVDDYYIMQKQRMRAGLQTRDLENSGEPHEILNWFGSNSAHLEHEVSKALDTYSNSFRLGRWARSIVGVGPVIAAGLMAYIDIEKAPTVGHIWRFAGLDPTSIWGKGQKRPWNAQLKVLCWKAADSFLKQSGRENDTYGHLLIQRLNEYKARNEGGEFSLAATDRIAKRGKTAIEYPYWEQGRLSPGHLLLRAERYTVKLFLSHYHAVAYELKFGVPPPKPFVLEHQGHAHFLTAPNLEVLADPKVAKLPPLP